MVKSSAPGSPKRGRDLRGVDFSVGGLAGQDLRDCDFRGVCLAGMDLSGTQLGGSDLSGTDLTGANLRGACLAGAVLVGAVLDRAILVDADLSDTDLDNASFVDVDARNVDLRRSQAFGVIARGACLDGARVQGAEWRRAVLTHARLVAVRGRSWRLDGADLDGADLSEAVLERACFDHATVEGLVLRAAVLTRTGWYRAVGRVDSQAASLLLADLRGADVGSFVEGGARLRGALVWAKDQGAHDEALRACGWAPPASRTVQRAVGGAAARVFRRAAVGTEQALPPALPDPGEVLRAQTRAAVRVRAVRRAKEARFAQANRRERIRLYAQAVSEAGSAWVRAVLGTDVEPARRDVIERERDFPVDALRREREVLQAGATRDGANRTAARRRRLLEARKQAAVAARATAERAEQERLDEQARAAAEAALVAEEARLREESEAARLQEAREAAEQADALLAAQEREAALREVEAAEEREARERLAQLARDAEEARREAEAAARAREEQLQAVRAEAERLAAEEQEDARLLREAEDEATRAAFLLETAVAEAAAQEAERAASGADRLAAARLGVARTRLDVARRAAEQAAQEEIEAARVRAVAEDDGARATATAAAAAHTALQAERAAEYGRVAARTEAERAHADRTLATARDAARLANEAVGRVRAGSARARAEAEAREIAAAKEARRASVEQGRAEVAQAEARAEAEAGSREQVATEAEQAGERLLRARLEVARQRAEAARLAAAESAREAAREAASAEAGREAERIAERARQAAAEAAERKEAEQALLTVRVASRAAAASEKQARGEVVQAEAQARAQDAEAARAARQAEAARLQFDEARAEAEAVARDADLAQSAQADQRLVRARIEAARNRADVARRQASESAREAAAAAAAAALASRAEADANRAQEVAAREAERVRVERELAEARDEKRRATEAESRARVAAARAEEEAQAREAAAAREAQRVQAERSRAEALQAEQRAEVQALAGRLAASEAERGGERLLRARLDAARQRAENARVEAAASAKAAARAAAEVEAAQEAERQADGARQAAAAAAARERAAAALAVAQAQGREAAELEARARAEAAHAQAEARARQAEATRTARQAEAERLRFEGARAEAEAFARDADAAQAEQADDRLIRARLEAARQRTEAARRQAAISARDAAAAAAAAQQAARVEADAERARQATAAEAARVRVERELAEARDERRRAAEAESRARVEAARAEAETQARQAAAAREAARAEAARVRLAAALADERAEIEGLARGITAEEVERGDARVLQARLDAARLRADAARVSVAESARRAAVAAAAASDAARAQASADRARQDAVTAEDRLRGEQILAEARESARQAVAAEARTRAEAARLRAEAATAARATRRGEEAQARRQAIQAEARAEVEFSAQEATADEAERGAARLLRARVAVARQRAQAAREAALASARAVEEAQRLARIAAASEAAAERSQAAAEGEAARVQADRSLAEARSAAREAAEVEARARVIASRAQAEAEARDEVSAREARRAAAEQIRAAGLRDEARAELEVYARELDVEESTRGGDKLRRARLQAARQRVEANRAARPARALPTDSGPGLEETADFRRDAAIREREVRESRFAAEMVHRRRMLFERANSNRLDAEGAGRSVDAARTTALLVSGGVRAGVRVLSERLNRPDAVPIPGADWSGKSLDERDLRGLDLRGVNFTRASLVGVDLREADLTGADLTGADLTAAALQGAILARASLDDAVLDQADVRDVDLETTSVRGARATGAIGLSAAARDALVQGGADLGQGSDSGWVRILGAAAAVALFGVIGVYAAARVTGGTDDTAALEHAATVAQQAGDPAEAATRFVALAATARDESQRVDFHLEAARAFEEAGKIDEAMEQVGLALITAGDGAQGPRVLLRQAQLQARHALTEAARTNFEALLERTDVGPEERASALIGLSGLLDPAERPALLVREEALLIAAETDVQRASLALALADGWAGVGDMGSARSTIQTALNATKSTKDRLPLSLRLAHLLAESGDEDGALALYIEVMGQPDGEEAALGAADLYARRGDDARAREILRPFHDSTDVALAARAESMIASIEERSGDTEAATAAWKRLLAIDGVEPRLKDEAYLNLARLLIQDDPEAAKRLVAEHPDLKDAVALGTARALREAGKRHEARTAWAALADDPTAGPEARLEAQLSIAELMVEDGDPVAVQRYDDLLKSTTSETVRNRIVLGAANALVRANRVQDAKARYDALLAQLSPTSTADAEVAAQCRLGQARIAELEGTNESATRLYLDVARTDGPWAVEALVSLGELRMRSGDYADAAVAFQRALSISGIESSRKLDVQIELAGALTEANDPRAADAYAALLTAPTPAVRVKANIAVGNQHLGSDAAGAQALFEQALREATPGPERAEARAGWLRSAVALGRVEGGLGQIRAWLTSEEDDALQGELAVAVVRALREEGQSTEALAIAEQYARVGGFELGMERAGALRDAGRAADAATLLTTLVPADATDRGWVAETEADARIEAGDFEGAQRVLLDLQRTGVNSACFGLARVAREEHRFKDAKDALGNCDDPRAAAERGQLLEDMGQTEEARQAWQRLAQAEDLETRTAGTVGLARLAMAQDDARAALAALEAQPVIDPGYALSVAQIRGEALRALNRVDDARAVYRALGSGAEEHTVGLLGLADCAYQQGEAALAASLFEEARASTTDDVYGVQALWGRFHALVEQGEPALAGETLTRLKTEYPDQADAVAAAAAAGL